MYRTTIMIPGSLKIKLESEAEKEKISFGELVRRALQKYLMAESSLGGQDPFLSSRTVFEDQGPTNVVDRHDDYLSGRDPHGGHGGKKGKI